jgi:hypothetical protein
MNSSALVMAPEDVYKWMHEIGLFIMPNQTRYSCEEKFVGAKFFKGGCQQIMCGGLQTKWHG